MLSKSLKCKRFTKKQKIKINIEVKKEKTLKAVIIIVRAKIIDK